VSSALCASAQYVPPPTSATPRTTPPPSPTSTGASPSTTMLIGMSSSVDSSSSSSATFVVDLLSPSTIRDERELRVAPSHTVTNHLSLPAGEAAVAAALGVVGALLLLAGVVGGVCWWRRVRRATVAFTTLHDET
jgi:hypothetical protein